MRKGGPPARLTNKNYPNSTSGNYAYDILSHLTQIVDPSRTYDFTYDNMGRLTSLSTQYSFQSGQTLVNNHTYNADFTNPQDWVTSYTYDSVYQLLTSKQDAATKETYT